MAETEGLEYTVTIQDSQGNEIPVAEYVEGGPNAKDFGDIRFTMPNDDVTITVTTEEYIPLDAPALSSSSTRVNRDVMITFEDNAAWRAAIQSIKVNDTEDVYKRQALWR